MRALGEDRATFYCPESQDAEALSREVNAWVDDQLSATSLSLLQSPAMWAAPESLTQVRQLGGIKGEDSQ